MQDYHVTYITSIIYLCCISKLFITEMPLGAMPVLEIDGKKSCQSNAIARYLAKKFGKKYNL